MNWLTRRLSKLNRGRAAAPGLRDDAAAPAQLLGPSAIPPGDLDDQGAMPTDLSARTWEVQRLSHPEADEEDEVEVEPEDDDPTIGRYEKLQLSAMDAADVKALRSQAEGQALSGAHRVYVFDPAGPGSLAETLARLEGEGRFVSRICEDPEAGPYIQYEPVDRAGPAS